MNRVRSHRAAWLGLTALALSACTGAYALDHDRAIIVPEPVIIDPEAVRRRQEYERQGYGGQRYERDGYGRSQQGYDIPPGHYPPPGSCRVWFPDRPPGHQPPPSSCNVRVPRGAVLIEG